MVIFSRVPESQMRWVRWALLLGWLGLIGSLLIPALPAPGWLFPACGPEIDGLCAVHQQPGNRLFWGTVVPVGVLLIGVVSHELWRRVCPLAFVSQLARALGRQRTRPGKRGKPELVLVDGDSWLGRHHVELQWSLLIAGLCLRLLLVNSSPQALALLLIVTLAAAITIGWAYGGKAWCHYVCPMGPVQTILTGMRGPLGSTAHVGSPSRVTQSMCRTLTSDGREQSACVACQAPCIDIDAERAFWQTLRGKRGLQWAHYSYPGLVIGFFLLMEAAGAGSPLADHPLGYLRSGIWAFDADLANRAWLPLAGVEPLPRLVVVPLALVVAGWISVGLCRGVEQLFQRRYRAEQLAMPELRAVQHTRLLATFVAINEFFWFVDPSLGLLGERGGALMRSLVLAATVIALHRSWKRDESTYRRESASESLRRQLKDLPGLELALDGRSIQALSPQEVFTLVKAMPALGQNQSRQVYRGVLEEMLRTGRLERATALLELQDLRQMLGLSDPDHHTVLRDVAREHPDLLANDRLERQVQDLRQEAAQEAIQNLLSLARIPVLDPALLPMALQEQIEQVRVKSGLDEAEWQDLLRHFGPQGAWEQRRLQHLRDQWMREAGLHACLRHHAERDGLLRPLAQAMALRVESGRGELTQRLLVAGLEPLPTDGVPAAGTLEEAFGVLWCDPDPDTAGWVLMLVRERDPQRLGAYAPSARIGLATSPFLESQQQGLPDPDRHEFPALCAAPLFADLPPADMVWLARQGHLKTYRPGDPVMRQGSPSDSIAVVIAGEVVVLAGGRESARLGVGQSIGEMGVITGRQRNATVVAGGEGVDIFEVPAEGFDELLQRSQRFSRGLLSQLVERLALATQA